MEIGDRKGSGLRHAAEAEERERPLASEEKLGQSIRRVARDLDVSRETVAKYHRVAVAEAWLQRPDLPAAGEIEQRLAVLAPQTPLGPRPAVEAYRARVIELTIRRSPNPWHVKELLGHEDFRSLDVYAKLTILDLKAAHRRHHPREQGTENPLPAQE